MVTTTSAPNNETPTLSSDSPRQTQYAYRSIDLVAREARRVRPFNPDAELPPSQLHGLFNADSWTGGANNNGPIGLNPLVNNNISVNGFDTDMSDAQNTSTGLTPQSNYSYNQSSSDTSYSPTQDEDPGISQPTVAPPISGRMNGYNAFTPATDNMFAAQNPNNTNATTRSPVSNNVQAYGNNSQIPSTARQNDPFGNMASWEKVSSPGPMQGMTPGEDWEKMMNTINQNLGWGMAPGSGMTPGRDST